MANLTNTRIQDTYGQVLTLDNTGNLGVDSTLRYVQDGDGSNSALQISTNQVNISGELLISGFNIQDFLNSGGSGTAGGTLTDSNNLAQFNDYGQLNYSTIPLPDLNHDIDKRIWELTATTGNKQIYSSINHATATYVRNTGCWAYGIDLTPISVWNSQGGDQRGGILISPRHVLMANHFLIASGSIMRWVDNNDNVISGGLSGSVRVGNTDLRIGVLSGDITGVSYAKVLSSGFTGYFNTSGIPLLFTDQEEKALVGESLSLFSNEVNIGQSSNFYRSGFYETPVGGDSGDPICCVIGNELVILSTFFAPTGDNPSVSYYFGDINNSIASLGNSNSYQLTPISQNYFPINWNQIKDAPDYGIINVYSGNLQDAVYTTGTQSISGIKSFPLWAIFGANGINFGNLNLNSGATVLATTDFGVAGDGYNIGIIQSGRLFWGESTTPSLDWQKKQLSGNWLTNTRPTQSGHLVNLGYVTGRYISGSGNATPPSDAVNPVSWQDVWVSGVRYKSPLYL